MKKTLNLILFTLFLINSLESNAQNSIPYTFENNSEYSDNQIYISLIGKYGSMGDVWMDVSTSTLHQMSSSDNTISGPSWSNPPTWQYPQIFTTLDNINLKTIQIPYGLYACRIFISFQSPMYLHFHDAGGYAGANLSNDTDPNDGIRWEIIELSWLGSSGLFTNTSRVDAYQYPMGLEVEGFTGASTGPTYADSYTNAINGGGTPSFGKVGELISHQEILNQWDTTVSTPFLVSKVVKTHSIDGNPIIEQPSKIPTFSQTLFDSYIDDIWSVYTTNDLVINIGDRGTWTGRVTGNEFNFTDPTDGSIATIYSKPTTINVIEGSGPLAYTPVSPATNIEKYNEDLMIQAQITAAINRHAIYTNQVAPSVQYSHDPTRFFVNNPYNEYVSFFHNPAISYNSKTYAFAYDDVGDQSSTLQCTFPVSAKVIIGGYSSSLNTSTFNPSENLTIYPNPSKKEIFINSKPNSMYEVYNLLGNKVISGKIENNKQSLNISELASGVYVVKVMDTNGHSSVSKFIKE